MHNWIKELKMEKHIEGGYFSSFYKSQQKVLPVTDNHKISSSLTDLINLRLAGTSIYFLLEKDDFSAWHKLKSDEIWHYYDGNSVINIHTINQNGEYNVYKLGHPRLDPGARFQVVVENGIWFAADLQTKSSFGLVGCSVSPGFEYQDFILADSEKLAHKYPKHSKIIRMFTRDRISAELNN
ncbi:MAG: cupin domain-containing protein [Legionellaceae bacterium]|nr:cupin domain-containing protein [Legionellaceae bacterium]